MERAAKLEGNFFQENFRRAANFSLVKFGKNGKKFLLTFVKKYDIIYIENKERIFFLSVNFYQ